MVHWGIVRKNERIKRTCDVPLRDIYNGLELKLTFDREVFNS